MFLLCSTGVSVFHQNVAAFVWSATFPRNVGCACAGIWYTLHAGYEELHSTDKSVREVGIEQHWLFSLNTEHADLAVLSGHTHRMPNNHTSCMPTVSSEVRGSFKGSIPLKNVAIVPKIPNYLSQQLGESNSVRNANPWCSRFLLFWVYLSSIWLPCLCVLSYVVAGEALFGGSGLLYY